MREERPGVVAAGAFGRPNDDRRFTESHRRGQDGSCRGDRRGSARAPPQRAARQDRDHPDQAAHHPTRPLARLFPRGGGAVPGDPGRSQQGVRLYRERQSGRGDLQRHGGAWSRQSRRARRQTGDGRQIRPVQALCRHRRDRPGGRHRGRGCLRRVRAPARSDLRRHQSRGHPGARLLRHRAAAARMHGHSGVPRRPARHRDHRRGRPDQRPGSYRTLAAGGQAGDQRRGRSVDRMHRAAQGHGTGRPRTRSFATPRG